MFKIVLLVSIALNSSFLYSKTELKSNHCVAKTNSKKYIENNFEGSYPRRVSFSCIYTCKSSSVTSEVKGITQLRITSLSDDAKRVVCQGVKVKQVSWGWDYDGVEQFYAFDTNINEVKLWASKNISRDNPYEVNLLYKLKDTLMEVANGYYKVGLNGYEYYHDAARILSKIANELPYNTTELDKYIRAITKKPNMLTKEGLVSGVLLSSAQFKIEQ